MRAVKVEVALSASFSSAEDLTSVFRLYARMLCALAAWMWRFFLVADLGGGAVTPILSRISLPIWSIASDDGFSGAIHGTNDIVMAIINFKSLLNFILMFCILLLLLRYLCPYKKNRKCNLPILSWTTVIHWQSYNSQPHQRLENWQSRTGSPNIMVMNCV